MWFKRKAQPPIRSLIGEGTRFDGALSFNDGMRIDGEVKGDVVALGDGPTLLVISEKARVIGKVMAAHVIINGEVEGPIVCSEMLELQPKARIAGDVHYKTLEMHQGATICGKMVPADTVVEEKPPLKLASSKQ